MGALIFSRKIENDIELDQKETDKIMQNLNSKITGAIEQSNYYIDGDKLILI